MVACSVKLPVWLAIALLAKVTSSAPVNTTPPPAFQIGPGVGLAAPSVIVRLLVTVRSIWKLNV